MLTLKRHTTGSKTVVAIHGLGSAGTAWLPLIPYLPSDIEFITIDLPGHGDSKDHASAQMSPAKLAKFIKSELSNESIEKFHLIGNSLGGWIALEMAAQFPKNVLSVTGVAPAGLWLNPKMKLNFTLSASRILAKLTLRYSRSLLKIKLMRFIGFSQVSPQWRKLSIQTCTDAALAMGSASGYIKTWEATIGQRFDSPIPEYVPISIIFGDTDNTLPKKDCQERSLAPNHSNWIILEKSGHAPMWDNSEAVSNILQEDIRKSSH